MVAKKPSKNVDDLCQALLLLKNPGEMYSFLKDLCTPQEMEALAERWHVCQLLHRGNLSYREIRQMTGSSLTTIGRIARFLKDEDYHGYRSLLEKINNVDKNREEGKK